MSYAELALGILAVALVRDLCVVCCIMNIYEKWKFGSISGAKHRRFAHQGVTFDMADAKIANRPLGRRPKLSQKIAGDLRVQVQSGALVRGQQLPTEFELVEQFGVSRTVIREAISALRVEGLLTAHQGRGVFVSDDLSNQPFRLSQTELSERDRLQQTMEIRLSIEVTSAELAAERRTEKDVAAIKKAMEVHHKAHARGEVGQKEDFAVHIAISEASKNTYIADFLRFLGPFIIPGIAMREMSSAELQAYQESLRSEHTEVFDAISAGDTAAAGAAMRRHLARGLSKNNETVTTKD